MNQILITFHSTATNRIFILLYSSKPLFVYFFNPKLDFGTEIWEKESGVKFIRIGFKNKEEVRIKKILSSCSLFLLLNTVNLIFEI